MNREKWKAILGVVVKEMRGSGFKVEETEGGIIIDDGDYIISTTNDDLLLRTKRGKVLLTKHYVPETPLLMELFVGTLNSSVINHRLGLEHYRNIKKEQTKFLQNIIAEQIVKKIRSIQSKVNIPVKLYKTQHADGQALIIWRKPVKTEIYLNNVKLSYGIGDDYHKVEFSGSTFNPKSIEEFIIKVYRMSLKTYNKIQTIEEHLSDFMHDHAIRLRQRR